MDRWNDQLSAYLDDDLSPAVRAELETHLATCEECQTTLSELRRVRDWAVQYPGREPTEAVWTEIAAGIDETDVDLTTDETAEATYHAANIAAALPLAAAARRREALRRFGIATLVAIALAGMGRQVVLERRASRFERHTAEVEDKARHLDAKLVELASEASWDDNATEYRGRIGQQFTMRCPKFGTPGTVWGTDVYTDDSSICTAAVHQGLITYRDGGVVTFEMEGAHAAYLGTMQNGVETRDYGSWNDSFRFVGGAPAEVNRVELIDWSTTATSMRGWEGAQVRYLCPPGEELRSVWGSSMYTDDSSICSAATHAGLITPDEGGMFTIEIRPGADEYQGSVGHGVRSGSFGEWSGSFVFVADDGTPIVDTSPPFIDWHTSAMDYRGRIGERYTFTCLAQGESRSVWGTTLYTDDSSICAAAAHAGVILARHGGVVTIEIMPGVASYEGTAANGIESRDFGEWEGSFRVIP